MTCHNCGAECRKFGKNRNGRARFQCAECKCTFTEDRRVSLEGMYLSIDKAEAILRLLLEGNSVSSVSRLTDVHIGTILRLLVKAGEKAEKIMARRIVNVQARDVKLDEVWSYVGKKQKRVKPEDDQNLGDNWTFVAIERHSKLVLNIAMGKRDQQTTDSLVDGIRHATSWSKFQITTDGFAAYRSAITTTLEDKLNGFAQLIKVYRANTEAKPATAPPKSLLWR